MRVAKVLVVDDHPETLEVLEVVLRIGGFEVTARADGRGALETDLDEYAAVLTDLAMPGMDGIELVRHLRARMPRPVPIVILTGQGANADCSDGHCCAFLRKPTLPDDLNATLRTLVESCRHECDQCAHRRHRPSRATALQDHVPELPRADTRHAQVLAWDKPRQ